MATRCLTIAGLKYAVVRQWKLGFCDGCWFSLCAHPTKALVMNLHTASRNQPYIINTGESIKRLPVPDDKVLWSIPWMSYDPPSFTVKGLSNYPWADPDIRTPGFAPLWNKCEKNVNRQSHVGEYVIKEGYPLNPCGRTGLQGRGRLGRWGPNHAGDAVVTRWNRDDNDHKVLHKETGLPILQFVSIQRRDTLQWALPGGMVDAGEPVQNTIQREFMEEALNVHHPEDFCISKTGAEIMKFLYSGKEIYKGYVDDPRNTDNAWMETVAHLFHDECGQYVMLMNIRGGDDAIHAEWVDASSSCQLYANHIKILKLAASFMHAHW